MEFSDELIIEGVARGIERGICANQALIDRIADAICARFDLLTYDEAAAVLDVSKRTVGNRVQDRSLPVTYVLGATEPRILLSEILRRAKEKCVHASASANVQAGRRAA